MSIFNSNSRKDIALKNFPGPIRPGAGDGGLISSCHRLPKVLLQLRKILIGEFNLTNVHIVLSCVNLFNYYKHMFSNKWSLLSLNLT